MHIISDEGRTSVVYRLEDGLVLKLPRESIPASMATEIENAFAVERRLLERLGQHPQIVHYHGCSETYKNGILLEEANGGDLQSYMDSNSKIEDALREKWSLQIAEAVAHVHEKNIIHSNLSTTNVLVHQVGQTTNILLADFGGSKCQELGIDGGLLPDHPFFDSKADINSKRLDVFSLGILLYIINTGQYPFHEGPAPQNEERFSYGLRTQALYNDGKFPDLLGVRFGEVISGCCVERRFATAGEVAAALKAEIQTTTYSGI